MDEELVLTPEEEEALALQRGRKWADTPWADSEPTGGRRHAAPRQPIGHAPLWPVTKEKVRDSLAEGFRRQALRGGSRRDDR